MKMDNVVTLGVKDFKNFAPLQTRIAGLLGNKRRKPPVSTSQAMHVHVWMIRKLDFWLARMQQVISIGAVNDIHSMPLVPEGVRQAINVHGIAAETVRRIESRQVEKVERTTHCLATWFITDIICCAAASQVKRAAASRPATRIFFCKLSDPKTFMSTV